MLDIRHFMRAKRWVQNPPSMKRLKLLAAVLAIALAIAGLQHFDLWPDWATAERLPRRF